jgi:hypothetical protein
MSTKPGTVHFTVDGVPHKLDDGTHGIALMSEPGDMIITGSKDKLSHVGHPTAPKGRSSSVRLRRHRSLERTNERPARLAHLASLTTW